MTSNDQHIINRIQRAKIRCKCGYRDVGMFEIPMDAVEYYVWILEFPCPDCKGASSAKRYTDTGYEQRILNEEFLAEPILIDKIPNFLVINRRTRELSTVDPTSLNRKQKVFEPLPAESYIIKPYTFSSSLEPESKIAKRRSNL